jgi:hypothetical protein
MKAFSSSAVVSTEDLNFLSPPSRIPRSPRILFTAACLISKVLLFCHEPTGEVEERGQAEMKLIEASRMMSVLVQIMITVL